MTAGQAAQYYVARGLHPIPIPFREKAPRISNWPALRLTEAELSKYFNGAPSNIGLILGDDYGTTDIDLDCLEAIAAASEFLPETGMIFGRKSKPRSHFLYRSDPPVRSCRFLDPIDKACLVELRCRKSDGSIGLQTIVPPSVHPEGEQISFEPGFDKHPANVDGDQLQRCVAKIASAALLVRHWPGKQAGRNAAFIAVAGALARAAWPIDDTFAFHSAIYRALWGTVADLDACRAEVASTYEKHLGGFETTGKRSLAELIDKRAVYKAFSWLGIAQQSMPARDEDAPPVSRPRSTAQSAKVALPKSESMEDLLANDAICIPQLMIEGFLPRCGLVLLGGRPKDGKSWFACQLALSVVTGEPLGDWLQVHHPGRVHLWALEDQKALTKDKMIKLLRGARPDGLRDLHVFDELAQPILRGGDQIIRNVLKEHPAELIILDSLFKLTGAQQPTYDISQRDYDVIDRVRKIALECNCATVIVMHTKKGSRGGNPVENIIGTSGTSAAADAVAELKRTSVREGKLTVVGRVVPQENFGMVWRGGPDKWGWGIENEGDEAALGETQQEVLEYLEAQGASKPATVANALHKSFGSIWMALNRLKDRGKVVRYKDKKWELAR
jgi:hypothetical protein